MKKIIGLSLALTLVSGAVTAHASAHFTGGGADTKITTAENWDAQPDLASGGTLVDVTGGTAATVPADDTAYAFSGARVGVDNFTFDAERGAKAVTLGALGLTNNASGTVWAWPTTLGAAASKTISNIKTTAPIFYSAKNKPLAIKAPLSGNDLFFQGSGRVDVYSTNDIPVAFVGNSNSGEPGEVNVYQQPGARLVKAGGTVNCSCKIGYGFHLMGGIHDYNILAGAHNNGNPSAFYVEAGTTNILKGSFMTQWMNESTMGIKGYLCVQGGLTATSIANAQGCWRPFSRYDSSYKTGYLKVETKPMTANRVCIPWGTLELAAAGNTFATRGLFIEQQGLVKTTAAQALVTGKSNKLKLSGGTFDLCGFDQGVDTFCGNGGVVTSAAGAQLHVADNAIFIDSKYNNGKPASNPALDIGTNATVVTTVFTGGAGLAKEGSLDLYIASANTSTGVLSVASGRLVLSAANSAETYPDTSITKTQGSWAGRVEVTGGTLAIEHSAAIGEKSVLYISGGSVELAEGVVLPTVAVYVTDGAGGWTELRGTCGGADSGAANQPVFPGTSTPVFTGQGKICVGAILPDGWPTAATSAAWTQAGADDLVTTAENWDPTAANVHDGSLFATFGAGSTARLPANDYIYMQGLTLAPAGFTLADGGADATLFLGPRGVTNTAKGAVWNWPASVGTCEPLWWLAKDSTMDLRAPLSGTGTVKVWGGGRLDVYATNTLQGTVYVGNSNNQGADPVGEIQVYLHPGAQLAGKGGTISVGCRAGYGLHLMGTTLDCNVVAGTQNVGSPGALFIEKGTTNVINGSFATQYGNLSYIGIAGHLTLRGGASFQTGSTLAMQRFRPLSAAAGVLRIEEKPVTSRLCEVAYGRLELAAAGNLFNRQGLWLNGGRVVIDADNALVAQGKAASGDNANNNLQISSGTLDLNGHDVQLDAINGVGGTVTSATAAQLRLKYNALHNYTGGQMSDYVKPYLSTGLVFRTAVTGAAGLTFEGSQTFQIAAVNTSVGTLRVTSGAVVLSDSSTSATYPGTAIKKTYGAWTAGRVEVSGGALTLEHRNALSRDVILAIATGATVEIPAGVSVKVAELWIDGEKMNDGIYGGADSAAPNKLALFTGAGTVRVGKVGFRVILGGTAGSSAVTPASEAKLTFGVLSDLHITYRGTASSTYEYGHAQTFVHALEYFRDAGVDAVVIAGDMADRGLPENLQVVANAWKEVFPSNTLPNGNKVERIFIYGNHDADASWFDSCVAKTAATEEEKTTLVNRSISRNAATVWQEAWGEAWEATYIKTVKGYRFVAAHWGHESEAVSLLNANTFDLHGSKPFFFIQHPHLKNTVYGPSAWGADSGATASALAAYPNAITFSGHSHYPVTVEGDIHQGDFTSIGCGSLSYVGHWGAECLNESEVSTKQRPGLLVKVYEDRVEVNRREFVKDQDLGDWRLDVPAATSGWPYAFAARQTTLAAPEFPTDAALATESVDAGLKLTIPAAVYDAAHARVLWYELTVKNGEGDVVHSGNVRQQGYFEAFGSVPATTTYVIPAASLPANPTIEVKAVDFFARKSAPLIA